MSGYDPYSDDNVQDIPIATIADGIKEDVEFAETFDTKPVITQDELVNYILRLREDRLKRQQEIERQDFGRVVFQVFVCVVCIITGNSIPNWY